MFHHIVPNEGPNGLYNGFCINLVVNSVKDGNENSIGLDVFISLAAFRTVLQFSRVNAFMCLFIEKKICYHMFLAELELHTEAYTYRHIYAEV